MIITNYSGILLFLVIAIILAVIVFAIPYLLSYKTIDREKFSSYECGFNPFKDSRNEFEIKFYLVAILFLIFDLEISFLFPWCVTYNLVSAFGFWTMMVFLTILTLGLIYEWIMGGLEWE